MKIVELHKLLKDVKGHTLHVMPGKEKNRIFDTYS